MDVKKFYDDIRERVKKLEPEFPDGWLYVVGLDAPDDGIPRMFSVTVRKAAELLVNRSHRVATADEVKAWEDYSEKTSQQIRKDQALRDRRSIFINNSEIGEVLGGVTDEKSPSSQKKSSSRQPSEGGR